MTAVWVWLVTSIVGIIAAAIYISNVTLQIKVARAERLSLQQPQLFGQLAAGLLIGLRMVTSTILGAWALAQSPLAQRWTVTLLSAGNMLTVLALIVLIVALNWTVHQDAETDLNAETGAPNKLRATADNKVVVEVTGVALEAEVHTAPKEPEES